MQRLLLLLIVLATVNCSTIRVFADHDSSIDFDQYTTFAFFKPGIEEVEISDLDKRRILSAIENQMKAKGLNLSSTPDLLINIAVKATDRVTVNNFNNAGWGWGWGWGWNPWLWNVNNTNVTTQTRGELFIDVIDAKTKLLVWQGKGYGGITEYSKNRDERIQAFVTEILANYPPEKTDKETL
ncbi:MAG: DUF4136 domain-containing protein [Flavobacteriaceae bacterium]